MSVRERIIDECIAKALNKIEQRGREKGNLDFGLLEAMRQTLTNLKQQDTRISDIEVHDAISVYNQAKADWDGPFTAMEDTLNLVINGRK